MSDLEINAVQLEMNEFKKHFKSQIGALQVIHKEES